jgi:hypothetical protein
MVAPEVNALLAVLMDTPGLKQEQIGPMLHGLYAAGNKAARQGDDVEFKGFYCVIHDMLEAWEG